MICGRASRKKYQCTCADERTPLGRSPSLDVDIVVYSVISCENIHTSNAPRWVAIRRRRHCGILSCIGLFSAMAHKLCSASWLMLSMASPLPFSISAMDADTPVRVMDANTPVCIPFSLARRILRLLSTLRYYIGKALATMIAADESICTIIREQRRKALNLILFTDRSSECSLHRRNARDLHSQRNDEADIIYIYIYINKQEKDVCLSLSFYVSLTHLFSLSLSLFLCLFICLFILLIAANSS